jgi:hypothetical protein
LARKFNSARLAESKQIVSQAKGRPNVVVNHCLARLAICLAWGRFQLHRTPGIR